MKIYTIYTDASRRSLFNDTVFGYAYVIDEVSSFDPVTKEVKAYKRFKVGYGQEFCFHRPEPEYSSEGELYAIVAALEALPEERARVYIYTDAASVIDRMKLLKENLKRGMYKGTEGNGNPRGLSRLFWCVLVECELHQVSFIKISSKSCKNNRLCDTLAYRVLEGETFSHILTGEKAHDIVNTIKWREY